MVIFMLEMLDITTELFPKVDKTILKYLMIYKVVQFMQKLL